MAVDCVVKVASLAVFVEIVTCSIAGLTYMDSLSLVPSSPALNGEDPCKPLYWYPRQIPDYCYFPKPNSVPTPIQPPPVPPQEPLPKLPPIQLPLPPVPIPMPMPVYIPMPGPPPLPLPMPGLIPVPAYGAPAPFPLGPPPQMLPGPIMQRGLIPGVDGIVSPEGAINILPFSDAYSDLLEKHKQTMIRRRLQQLLDEYEYFSKKKRSHRKHRHNY